MTMKRIETGFLDTDLPARTTVALAEENSGAALSAATYESSKSDVLRSGHSQHSSSSKNRPHQPVSVLSSQTSEVFEELNRLKFSSLGLYGRDVELRVLLEFFDGLATPDDDGDPKEQPPSMLKSLNLIAVRGEAGAGKSALFKEFSARLRKRHKGVTVAWGECNLHVPTPYGAFTSILTQLCDDIRSHALYESKIQKAILKAVGRDYRLLLDLIPNIGELIFEAGDQAAAAHESSQDSSSYNIVKSKERFKFLLRRFLHAVCRPEHMVVFVFDDVQWMDPASLQLLEIVLNDTVLERSLLVICVHRNDQLDETHNVAQLLSRIQETRGRVAKIMDLPNLSRDSMESWIADLLSTDRERVHELSDIVYRRVDGNLFFAIQFLTTLRDSGHLYYNIASMKWSWRQTDIQSSTEVTRNVLAALMEKVERLPADAKQLLQVVACLGASFDDELVCLITANLDDSIHLVTASDGKTARSPKQILDSLEEQGLLELLPNHGAAESLSKRKYCFPHSQIGLAAHEILDAGSVSRIKFQVGRVLFANKDYFDYHNLLFTTVDLWNAGADFVQGSKQSRILVDLNFEAGKRAIRSLAFEAAINYLKQALYHIPESKQWTGHYQLTLGIYNCLIKAEYANGSWDQMREHCQEIIELKGRSVMDKIVAYTAMITLLSTQEHNHIDAISLAVEVLKDLGFKFRLGIAGKFAMIGGIIKTKKLLSKAPLEGLLARGEMRDEKRLVALDIMATVNSSLYGANPDLLLCTVLATLRWSLKYGVSKDTAKCVSFYGLVEMALGNADGGTKACKLAVQLAEQQNLMHNEYAPTSAVFGFVLPWTSPLHICANQLLAGYNAGLETGDLHYGFMNITLFCFFSYCMGKSLQGLESDMHEYARQMQGYQQSLQLQFLSLTWQTALNMMGRCEGNPAVLNGQVCNFQDMLQTADNDKCLPLRAQVQCHQLQLAVYYRDFDLAAKLIRPAGSIAMVNPAHPMIWRNALFEGVAAFELVRRGKRKWKPTALNALARMKKWVDAGNVNCVHILYLLQAEKAAILESNIGQARRLYDLAISTAARNGFRNDRALATERAADMYAGLDEYWHAEYFQKASEVYREWQAWGKVEQMKKKKHNIKELMEERTADSRNSHQSHPETATAAGCTTSPLTGICFPV